jgi:non-specific serine/threonine protein kinase
MTAACRALATELLQSTANVRILATSREALGVAGESVWRVPPLQVPDLRAPGHLSRRELGRYESAPRNAPRARRRFLTDQNAGSWRISVRASTIARD